ncbi:hypothetical protein HY798_02240 [Candidatus Falkowbacteria bacterium]|nr:hypothetical protein [Candidatus Falkowbacteria bacterium]
MKEILGIVMVALFICGTAALAEGDTNHSPPSVTTAQGEEAVSSSVESTTVSGDIELWFNRVRFGASVANNVAIGVIFDNVAMVVPLNKIGAPVWDLAEADFNGDEALTEVCPLGTGKGDVAFIHFRQSVWHC